MNSNKRPIKRVVKSPKLARGKSQKPIKRNKSPSHLKRKNKDKQKKKAVKPMLTKRLAIKRIARTKTALSRKKTPTRNRLTAKTIAPRAKRSTKTLAKPVKKSRIVRIMGEGQFTVDRNTLKKLNEIDTSIVQLVSNDRSDDVEFKKRLIELTDIVEKNGKPLDPKEIIQSDIILPSADLSIDEAKKLFKGEGVIPEI